MRMIVFLFLSLCCAVAVAVSDVGVCPDLQDIAQELSYENVHRAAIAATLSQLVYTLDDFQHGDIDYNKIDSNMHNSVFWESSDGVDAVLLTQYADSNIKYCMAVFRGTQPELWKSGGRDDWVSNMDLRESIIQFQGQTCHVHRGYHEAYVNFEYRDEIEDYLQNCQQTCQDECDVILTGHSQGGTIAIMAAMEIMKQQQQTTSVPPFVVTLGAPQGLGTGCRGFLTELGNHYGGIHISCGWFHYIMSTTGTFGLTYDAVPMVFPHLLNGLAAYAKAKNDHGITHDEGFAFLGHELLVTTQQVDSLLYIGLDQHRFGMPYSAQAHWDWLYKEVLVDMLEATASATMSSLPTNGFAPGSMCNINEECSSHCCKRETFTWTLTCC